MKQLHRIVFLIAALSFHNASLAQVEHDETLCKGHNHSNREQVTELQLRRLGIYVVRSLIHRDRGLGFGKLDASWKDIPFEDSTVYEQTEKHNVVAIENKQQERTLYIKVSKTGSVYDASFDSSFPRIEERQTASSK